MIALPQFSLSMTNHLALRFVAAGLALAVAACGGGSEGEELIASNSQLSAEQIDAALGPADQPGLDSLPAEGGENEAGASGNDMNSAEEQQ